MFDNERFITKRIQDKISLELQLFLWNCIDELKNKGQKLDYLQVFEISSERIDDIFFEKIEHRQEEPEYRKKYIIVSNCMLDEIIFVIDIGSSSIMMLDEEY